MATQRVTLAKVGGVAAEIMVRRLREWSDARQQPVEPNLWSPDQWPAQVRAQADALSELLRANSLRLPVVHFVEWSDFWSMGDLFMWAFTPPDGPPPMAIHADRFEIHAYAMPDNGQLTRHLSAGAPGGFIEADWLGARLREAVEAWDKLVDPAVLVVLRQVVGGSALDEEVAASLDRVPDWLARDED